MGTIGNESPPANVESVTVLSKMQASGMFKDSREGMLFSRGSTRSPVASCLKARISLLQVSSLSRKAL